MCTDEQEYIRDSVVSAVSQTIQDNVHSDNVLYVLYTMAHTMTRSMCLDGYTPKEINDIEKAAIIDALSYAHLEDDDETPQQPQ